jgi:predicted HD superfamily hydrolase involved in NAD metabolism
MLGEIEISALRKKIKNLISEKRYDHTLGVEECAVSLSKKCLPGFEFEIAAAALLHDVTKELSSGEQLSLLLLSDIHLTDDELQSPEIFHSLTAPYVIKRDFSEFATRNVLSAVENHTVGAPDMSVFDEIIFLSDYIETGRKYDSSKKLHNYVFENLSDSDIESNIAILHEASLISINCTIDNLISKKRFIIPKTILTRNALLAKILHI